MTLHTARPYQADLIARTKAAWAAGKRNVLVVSPTGSGKTFLFANLLAEEQNGAVAIAHRRELVSQMSLALAREHVRHRVIAPIEVARECAAIHIEELGRDYTDPRARVAAAGVDTLVGMDPRDPWFAQVGLWVQDECFPAGTLVSGRPIESLRPGDEVDAFNEQTGLLEPRRVMRLFKNPKPAQMARVSVQGRNLDCTLGHPFYTRRGWIEAGNLRPDDELLLLPVPGHADRRGPTLPVPEDGADLLPEVLRHGLPGGADCSERGAYETAPARSAAVPGLWVGSDCRSGHCDKVRPGGTSVLQPRVLSSPPAGSIFEDCGSDERPARQRPDEVAQPDGLPRDGRENARVLAASGAPARSSGRQRPSSDQGRNGTCHHDLRPGLCPTVGHQDGQAAARRNTPELQAGPGAPSLDAGDRGGRREPRGETPGPGREKGRLLEWTRLDGVEIFQCPDPADADRSSDRNHVFNIEVEGLNTYLANGVVVHNCHHVLKTNKWGRACAMFPNARGLGVTATPMRADGKGLGRHADGLFDEMLVGPSMRELIGMGFLSDYRLIIAESHFDVSDVPVGDSGDYSPAKLAAARRKAREVTGDVVKTYLTYAPFKRGVTFEVDVESATETAAAFRAAGVPAEVVTAKTPSAERRAILRRFRNGQVLQLVNVDLFGEGFDLPAIEVVSFARPTTSYGLYVQQFGRALRLMKGKGRAIIIDHVGAWKIHGLPDNGRDWTLDRRERASRGTPSDVIPLRHCPKCATAYERVFPSCPECGDSPEPAVRSGPEHVDGDLFELDPDVLARMRGEIARVDGAALIPQGVSHIAQLAARKNHVLRQQASHSLRHTLALWVGWQNSKGRDDRESFRRFWFRYGVDVASAQALNAADSSALQARIKNDLDRANVIDGSVTNA